MYMCLGQVMGVLHQPQRVNQPAGGWAGLDQGTLHKLCSLAMMQQVITTIPVSHALLFGLEGKTHAPSWPLLWCVDVIIMASLVDLKLNPCAPHLDCIIAWLCYSCQCSHSVAHSWQCCGMLV
jgi:hypothetical protein